MKAPRFGPLPILFALIAILGVVLGHNWWQPGRSPWLLALAIGGCLIARQIAYGQRWLFYWIPLIAGFIAFGEGLIEGATQGSVKLPLESEAFDWAATAIAFVLMGVIAYWRQKHRLIEAGSPTVHWIQRLPPRFRTRRGFGSLIAIVAFLGYGGWHLFVSGDSLVWSLAHGIGGAIGVTLLFWPISNLVSGFDESAGTKVTATARPDAEAPSGEFDDPTR
jgi:hypothetical protein